MNNFYNGLKKNVIIFLLVFINKGFENKIQTSGSFEKGFRFYVRYIDCRARRVVEYFDFNFPKEHVN